MAKKLDLLGKRFNRIIITRYLGIEHHHTVWEYTCDCGKIKSDYGSYINAGRIQSCGCLVIERIGSLNRQEYGQSAKRRLITIYKKRAKKKNYTWNLSDEQFFKLTTRPCHYCGVLPFNDTKKISPNSFGHYIFNGIDRIDSNSGYLINNCVPCCHNCNLAKCDFSYKEFINWINRLIQFRSIHEFNHSINI